MDELDLAVAIAAVQKYSGQRSARKPPCRSVGSKCSWPRDTVLFFLVGIIFGVYPFSPG